MVIPGLSLFMSFRKNVTGVIRHLVTLVRSTQEIRTNSTRELSDSMLANYDDSHTNVEVVQLMECD